MCEERLLRFIVVVNVVVYAVVVVVVVGGGEELECDDTRKRSLTASFQHSFTD